jgi:hypothetical protein
VHDVEASFFPIRRVGAKEATAPHMSIKEIQ